MKALITGAASGIGLEISNTFKSRGYDVIGLDKNPHDGILSCDVRDKKQIESIFAELKSLDLLVNCAGVYKQGDAAEISGDDINEIVDTNLKGAMFTTKFALPLLRNSGGAIINIASGLGIAAEAESPTYCATKAGLIHFTKCVALAEAPTVRVNAICPGPVDTPMLRDAFATPKKMTEYLQTVPLKRLISPSEVAQLALFLTTDAAINMTGSILTLDGGESISGNRHGSVLSWPAVAGNLTVTLSD